jgi:FMN-dependent NADH-azoreductase
MKVLHIDSSITGSDSVSRQLSGAVVDAFKAANPGTRIVRRDLESAPFPHLDSKSVAAVRAGTAAADDATALEEFLAADVVVVGAPMYNLGIPSQLKAWIDRIAVAGKTFRYTAEGPQGLAGGKKVIVASSRGGIYTQGPAAAYDFQENYLRAVFGFIGITDVVFVRAEGVAIGPELRETAIRSALASVPATVVALSPVQVLV